jgi:hypothetical protein
MILSPSERSRLISVLGMLASEHAGERAAAALLASRLLRDKGLAWGDVVAAAPAETPDGDAWRRQAMEAARFPGLLTEWERGFLRRLVAFPRISSKQAAALQKIVIKVRA